MHSRGAWAKPGKECVGSLKALGIKSQEVWALYSGQSLRCEDDQSCAKDGRADWRTGGWGEGTGSSNRSITVDETVTQQDCGSATPIPWPHNWCGRTRS